MNTSLGTKVVEPSEEEEVLSMLRIAAMRLNAMGVDQWQYWLDPPAYKMTWLSEGIANREYRFVYNNDDLIGVFRLSDQDLAYWGKREDRAFYVHSLVILPEHNGLGYGYKILTFVRHEAIKAGVAIMRLDCHAGNTGLCRYYERYGFVKVGTKDMPHSLNNLYELRI